MKTVIFNISAKKIISRLSCNILSSSAVDKIFYSTWEQHFYITRSNITFIKQAPTHMQIQPIHILMNTQIHLISSVTYD